jgi:hypothetical protein
MERLRRFLKDYPAIGVALVLFLVYAGTAGAQQMKLSDGTFAFKMVQYNLDGTASSAGGGDATAANQTTQITHASAIETATEAIQVATESAQQSLDNIEASLSADAVAGNAAIATGPQLMAYGKATAPTAVDADDAVQVWADLNGRLQVNTAQINGVAPSMGNGASGTGVQRVTIASDSTGVIGATQSGTWNVGLSAGTNYAGKVRLHDGTNDALVDPCQSVAKTTTAFSQTSIANIITADANKTNYICAITIVASAAEVVSVVEDDTSGCGSLTAVLVGSTTAANGVSLAANGGFAVGNGESAVIKGSANNRYLCLAQDGADRISGFITWVQR